MKILARQLTVDMYDCKNKDLSNYEDLRESLDMAMNMAGYTPIEVRAQLWNEEQAIVFILLQEGHAVVRTYPKLKYVASDVFICQEDGKPEKAIKALKKLMKRAVHYCLSSGWERIIPIPAASVIIKTRILTSPAARCS